MRINPGTCALIVETVRPYSERLIDLVFLSPTHPVGHPRVNEDGLAPTLAPLNEVSALTLHPPVAQHLTEHYHRRHGMVAADYVLYPWTDTTTTTSRH